jgi:hypothetical protein
VVTVVGYVLTVHMHLPTQVANKFFILLLLVLIHFLKLPCPGREGGSRRLYKVKAPKSQKFNKRSMAGTITGETKREDQKRDSPEEPKKKLVPLVVGSYLTHGPS